jgi:hypothetical protein
MKTKNSLRTCFLSAPFGTDTRVLERELGERGFTVTDGRTVAATEPLIQEIKKRISEADLICVVAPSDISVNSAFELGVAVGTGKQVIVFAPLGTALPSDLLGVMYCSAPLEDSVGIVTFLDAYLAHGRSSLGKAPLIKEPHLLSKTESGRLRRRLASARGRDFEQLVKTMFESAGYVASETLGPEDQGVDFAVWVDSLQHSFGNPIIVQVKDRLSRGVAAHNEEILRWAIQRSRGRLGLLIYGSSYQPSEETLGKGGWPLVLRFGASELLSLFERGAFESKLIELRNRAVHGIEMP